VKGRPSLWQRDTVSTSQAFLSHFISLSVCLSVCVSVSHHVTQCMSKCLSHFMSACALPTHCPCVCVVSDIGGSCEDEGSWVRRYDRATAAMWLARHCHAALCQHDQRILRVGRDFFLLMSNSWDVFRMRISVCLSVCYSQLMCAVLWLSLWHFVSLYYCLVLLFFIAECFGSSNLQFYCERFGTSWHDAVTLVKGLDWIEQCFYVPANPQYRLYGRRFLQVKRPNQQYQSTEGTNS